MPGKKLLLRSILFCRKFCSDAVFDVLWMSTMYFIGIVLPSAFVAHQPVRRFHWSVCDEPLPGPVRERPGPDELRSSALPVVISVALYFDQMCRGHDRDRVRDACPSPGSSDDRRSVNVTTLPFVVIFVRPVFHMVEYCEPASLPVSKVNFTSAAVNGLPSFHLTPLRTVTT